MSHVDNAPTRPRQANSSNVARVTPPQGHHLRGKTLPLPPSLIAAGVQGSKQHRAPTWSPGQVLDVEHIPSDVCAGLLPSGAQRPTPPSATSSVTLNTNDDQTAPSANPRPFDIQSHYEDTNAEVEITWSTPMLSRPNLHPIDHSYLSSEAIHSSNQATASCGTGEITLDVPIASVNQEPGTSTRLHHWWSWSRWGESFKGLRHQWRRWRSHWKIWCLLAMVIALSLGIPLGFALRIKDISIPYASDAANNSDVLLSATLVTIDPDQKTATFDWFVDKAACNSNPCEDYDIFFDQNLLIPSTGGNNSIPSDAVFSINGTLLDGVNESLLANQPFFTTKISLIGGENGARKERTLQAYPFDHYLTQIFIFAKVKNRTFNIDDLASISIDHSDGIAVGFTATMNDDSSLNQDFVILNIDVARGRVVRIYCVIIVIAIWLVTLTELSVTISAVFLRREMANEVMVVPVATLFAFTQLRSTFPGAPPGFGIILDFIGVLPCLAILSFCAIMLLAVFLFYNPEHPHARKDKSDPESKHLSI